MSSSRWETQTIENEFARGNLVDEDANQVYNSTATEATDEREDIVRQLETAELQTTNYSVVFVRALALLCACSLSIGSH